MRWTVRRGRPHAGGMPENFASSRTPSWFVRPAARSWTDHFGNCVVEVEHPCLNGYLEVEAEFQTARAPGEDEGNGNDGKRDESSHGGLRFVGTARFSSSARARCKSGWRKQAR